MVELGVVAGQVDARVEAERPRVVEVVHEAAAGAEGRADGLVHHVLAERREAGAEDEVGVDLVELREVEHRVEVEHRAPRVVEVAVVALGLGLALLVPAVDAVLVRPAMALQILLHRRGDDDAAFEAPPFGVIVADADREVERVLERLVALEVPEADAGAHVPAAEIGVLERFGGGFGDGGGGGRRLDGRGRFRGRGGGCHGGRDGRREGGNRGDRRKRGDQGCGFHGFGFSVEGNENGMR